MITLTQYPRPVARALQVLIDRVTPPSYRVYGLVVYGSLARGDYQEGDSTVDLVVVLEDASPASLDAVREPLYEIAESVQLQPLLVGRAELSRLADVFPILVSDIKRHHDFIFGAGAKAQGGVQDPFIDLEVKREDLRLQVEHELRNHPLRLRRYYLLTGGDVQQLSRAIVTGCDALVIELGAMLELMGKSPDPSNSHSVFAVAAEAFKLDHSVLTRICEFKPSEDPAVQSPSAVAELFYKLLDLVEGAVAAVDQLDIKVWGSIADRSN